MQNKNIMISFMQAFGIVLVVLGHSFYGSPTNPVWNEWMHTFRMPLFMFLSGYLLNYVNERKGISLASTPLPAFIRKKAKRLLIPYAVVSTLAFLPKTMLSKLAARPIDLSVDGYIHMLLYPHDNVIIYFWFLPTLFIIFMIVVFGARLLQRFDTRAGHIALMLVLVLLHVLNPLKDIYLLNIGGVAEHMVYFMLGYYTCRSHIIEKIGRHVGMAFCLTVAFSVAFFLLVSDFPGKSILSAACGILAIILLAKLYVDRQWHFTDHLFGASYAIYLFSWFPQVASQQILLGITHVSWQVGSALALTSGIYIPLLIYKLIQKNKKGRIGRWVALLTGQ